MQKHKEIVEIARSWAGTPYAYQQSIKNVGVDCIQFILAVLKEAGVDKEIELYKYSRISNPNRIKEYLNIYADQLDQPHEGCIVHFGIRPKIPTHFGFYSELYGKPAIIHASSDIGKVVEHNIPKEQMALIDSYWWVK
jgi:cell wall-associated NlpC family hydrolase